MIVHHPAGSIAEEVAASVLSIACLSRDHKRVTMDGNLLGSESYGFGTARLANSMLVALVHGNATLQVGEGKC